jgi:hypothetical protein
MSKEHSSTWGFDDRPVKETQRDFFPWMFSLGYSRQKGLVKSPGWLTPSSNQKNDGFQTTCLTVEELGENTAEWDIFWKFKNLH